MDYQFLEDFKKLSVQCPPQSYKPKNIPVFRWVFDDILDERNFKPRYFLIPQRELEKVEKISNSEVKDAKNCSMLALSFFDSEQAAKDRFYDLKDTTCPIAYKVLGTNIAICNITENDGLNEEPNDIGHFNHHPIKEHNYENRFTVISKL